jgi:hypothetical protein
MRSVERSRKTEKHPKIDRDLSLSTEKDERPGGLATTHFSIVRSVVSTRLSEQDLELACTHSAEADAGMEKWPRNKKADPFEN